MQIVDKIRDSPTARVYLIFTIFALTIILSICRFTSNIDHNQEETPPGVKLHSTNTMSSDLSKEPMVGGLGPEGEIDQDVINVVAEIKPELESKSSLKFDSIDVLSVRRQMVAGVNYFIKAKAKLEGGEEKILHLRVYKHFKDGLSLSAYQLDKKLEDKLEYFQ